MAEDAISGIDMTKTIAKFRRRYLWPPAVSPFPSLRRLGHVQTSYLNPKVGEIMVETNENEQQDHYSASLNLGQEGLKEKIALHLKTFIQSFLAEVQEASLEDRRHKP